MSKCPLSTRLKAILPLRRDQHTLDMMSFVLRAVRRVTGHLKVCTLGKRSHLDTIHLNPHWTTTRMSSFLESSIISQSKRFFVGRDSLLQHLRERERKGNVAVRLIPPFLSNLYLPTHTTALALSLLLYLFVSHIIYIHTSLYVSHTYHAIVYTLQRHCISTHMMFEVISHTCISSSHT